MSDLGKDTKNTGSHAAEEKKRERKNANVCEICGQALERDPESGEYLCPYCDYDDDKA